MKELKVLGSLCIAAVVSLGACAGPVMMTGTRAAPAARGEVKTAKGDNGNTVMRIKVEHMAPPEQVAEHAKAYVVWVQSVDHVAPPSNVGELRVGEDLAGSIETITTLTEFDLTITPESSAQVATPEGKPVLTARVSRES